MKSITFRLAAVGQKSSLALAVLGYNMAGLHLEALTIRFLKPGKHINRVDRSH